METHKLNQKCKLVIAFMSWDGITIPNAAILSKEIAKSSVFTSVETRKIIVHIGERNQKMCGLDEVPKLSDAEVLRMKSKLDETGVIRIGQQVNFNDILVAKIADKTEQMTPDEKLIQAIFGSKATSDCSERMPFHDMAIVVDVERNDSSITLYLAFKREIQIGDTITDDKGNEVIVADIVDQGRMPVMKKLGKKINLVITSSGSSASSMVPLSTDRFFGDKTLSVFSSKKNENKLFISEKSASSRKDTEAMKYLGSVIVAKLSLIKKTKLSEEKVKGFGIPYFSLFQQPLNGIKITNKFLVALKQKGLHISMQELLTTKSDAQENHTDVVGAIMRKQIVPKASMTNSFKHWDVLLQGLGFKYFILNDEIIVSPMNDAEMATSYGEVLKDSTLNFRIGLPENDGLFCQKIFGPVRDYHCACGKYKRVTYKDIVCDKCGVTVLSNDVRFERFGHIKLAMPVVHPFFQKEMQSFCTEFPKLKDDDSFSSKDFYVFIDEYIQKHAQVEAVMKYVPVIPPGHRPLVQLNDGGYASSDLNDLYRRVVIRNNRLRRLNEIKAPAIILLNEVIMLQQAVEGLFNGMYHGDKHALKGLTQYFAGTNQHLFEKKATYALSGGVIPNTKIAIDECILPISASLTMLEPFVCQELLNNFPTYDAFNKKGAEEMVKMAHPFAVQALNAVLKDKVVLITSSQQTKVYAFKVIASEDSEVIGLHPKAIEALEIVLGKNNTAIVHFPLSQHAQTEASSVLFTGAEETIDENVGDDFSSVLHFSKKDLCEIITGQESGVRTLTDFDKMLCA